MIATTDSAPIATLADPRIKEKLQELRLTDNLTNWRYFARTYLYFFLVIGGTLWFYHARVEYDWAWAWNVPVTLLAIILVGAGQHQLTSLSHEASHHILFKNRLLNDLASDWLCMFPMFSSTHHYRLQHLAHHQFVNDPERDPDISQLRTSGHWLKFPVEKAVFLWTLLKQFWLPNLLRYIIIRGKYNSVPTANNPYLKKDWKPNKLTVRVGLVYLLTLIGVLTALVVYEQPLALAIVPTAMWVGIMAFYYFIPERLYHQTRIHPVISMRATSLGRMTYMTGLFVGLAWLSLLVTPYAVLYYLLLWAVPILTSFSFFMILRQIVQHGNGDRGWLNNTRVFRVHPFIQFSVFPMGMEYHLPHHLYVTIPHYRLRELHEFLIGCQEYREQAVEVEGYFLPYERPAVKPTVIDVLGPDFYRKAEEIYIDNAVLETESVEEKDEILRQGEEEKRKRRAEFSA